MSPRSRRRQRAEKQKQSPCLLGFFSELRVSCTSQRSFFSGLRFQVRRRTRRGRRRRRRVRRRRRSCKRDFLARRLLRGKRKSNAAVLQGQPEEDLSCLARRVASLCEDRPPVTVGSAKNPISLEATSLIVSISISVVLGQSQSIKVSTGVFFFYGDRETTGI